MLYSLMGLSPPRLLYGPAANYGSIIIPCGYLCRPRSNLVCRAELALVRLAESWRTGDELGPQVTYPIFCVFSFQEGSSEVISIYPSISTYWERAKVRADSENFLNIFIFDAK